MLQLQVFSCDGNQHAGAKGNPDLCFDCILVMPKERFDAQMLLDPLASAGGTV